MKHPQSNEVAAAPGEFKCPDCGFVVVKSTINAETGAIGPVTGCAIVELCPNGVLLQAVLYALRMLRDVATIRGGQVKYQLERDGDQWCATSSDFVNLQESPAGFGDTADAAIAELVKQELAILAQNDGPLQRSAKVALAQSDALCKVCYGTGDDPKKGDGISSYCQACEGTGLASGGGR